MIELLAPAGNPEALRGAVYAGADTRIHCPQNPNLPVHAPAAQMASRALCWGGYA